MKSYRHIVAAATAIAALASPHPSLALLVQSGDTLRASTSDAEVINHGAIIGEATALVVFGPQTRLSGDGYFENTIILGAFAPGNSPGITTGANQAFGATANLQFELGGPLPGFGAGFHDQVRDAATLSLIGGPTLSVLAYGGYVPTAGQEFKIITWQTGLAGAFGAMVVDPFFTSHGITFTQLVTNPTGPGDLTLIATAVPEAGAFWFVSCSAGLIGAALALHRLGGLQHADDRTGYPSAEPPLAISTSPGGALAGAFIKSALPAPTAPCYVKAFQSVACRK